VKAVAKEKGVEKAKSQKKRKNCEEEDGRREDDEEKGKNKEEEEMNAGLEAIKFKRPWKVDIGSAKNLKVRQRLTDHTRLETVSFWKLF
jgi:hypothetical protein